MFHSIFKIIATRSELIGKSFPPTVSRRAGAGKTSGHDPAGLLPQSTIFKFVDKNLFFFNPGIDFCHFFC